MNFLQFSGLVGDVQMNRSDVGWADLYLFPQRKAVADFTFPHMYYFLKFNLILILKTKVSIDYFL